MKTEIDPRSLLRKGNVSLENALLLLSKTFDTPSDISKVKKHESGFIYDESIEIKSVFESDDTTITYTIFHDSGVSYPKHKHENSIEYLIVTSGSVLISTTNFSRKLDVGECSSIKCEDLHEVKSLVKQTKLIAICVPAEQAYRFNR